MKEGVAVSIRRFSVMVAMGLACMAQAGANVFEMPELWGRHMAFRDQMLRAMKSRDWVAMEHACRGGVALLPTDPVWSYNLACALALQGRRDEGLDALGKAIDLGFRDIAAIERDNDLLSLKNSPRFAELMRRLRDLREKHGAGDPRIVPATADPQGVVWVSAQNTQWDLDLGIFRSYLAPTEPPTAATETSEYGGPLAEEMRDWLAAGTAAGNRDDFYDNRDDGHSRLDVRLFPGITEIRYDAQARKSRAHYGAAHTLFNQTVIGNSSTALTSGWRWRSIPRALLIGGHSAALLFAQYANGQIYCYPGHRDYDADYEGDLFPANTPYMVVTRGSSGSDLPALNALAGALAAFHPETKAYLKRQNLVAPTLQMLLRVNQRQVREPRDYLTGVAHRPVFDTDNLMVEAMLRMAHDLRVADVPPMVVLRVLREDQAVSNRDYFDAVVGERLFDTPSAIARVARGVAHKRRISVAAASSQPAITNLTWRWVLLQGDPAKVEIAPLKPDNSAVDITVAHHEPFHIEPGGPMRSSRVDIGVFANNGRHYSAPAFVSFYYLRNELRRYDAAGRILSVDYAGAADRYTDPMLSLPRQWRDIYDYDAAGRMIGWTRLRGDQTERFTADGLLVEHVDRLGRATTARSVHYLPRQTVGDHSQAPELIQVVGDIRVTYRYADDQDRVGQIVSRVRVAD